MNQINLAVIPGDGIGPEVTSVALECLTKALGETKLETTTYPLGADRYLSSGEALTNQDLEALAGHLGFWSEGYYSSFDSALTIT